MGGLTGAGAQTLNPTDGSAAGRPPVGRTPAGRPMLAGHDLAGRPGLLPPLLARRVAPPYVDRCQKRLYGTESTNDSFITIANACRILPHFFDAEGPFSGAQEL